MPTVLQLHGWRFFFYADEGSEPLHIHCEKAEKEAKFWLDRKTRAITVAYAYNFSPRDLRETRRVIAAHFDDIEKTWTRIQFLRGRP